MSDGPPDPGAPVRHRSTRDRPAKAPLSREAVVDAAIAVLKSEGLKDVTMRRVAAALDTGAASLYAYVPGRDGLLQAMIDRVIATIELEPPDPGRWRAQLHSLLERTREAFIAHPGLAATSMIDPPQSESILLYIENMLGTLLAGGLDAQGAAWACDVLGMLVSGLAAEEDMRQAHGQSTEAASQEYAQQIRATFAGLSAARFPLLSMYALEMTSGDSDERFRFAVDVVVDGVVARAARHAATTR